MSTSGDESSFQEAATKALEKSRSTDREAAALHLQEATALALLAIVTELQAIRHEVADVATALTGPGGYGLGDHMGQIVDSLEKIAGRPR